MILKWINNIYPKYQSFNQLESNVTQLVTLLESKPLEIVPAE